MLKRISNLVVFIALLLIAFLLVVRIPKVTAQGLQEFVPNDPKYSSTWAHQLDLPLAWAEMQRIEQTTGPVGPDAVVLVFDGWINASHPDLSGHVLTQYNVDYTGEPTYEQQNHDHGSQVASVIIAGTNNGIGPTSVAGLSSHVKIVSVKISATNGTVGSPYPGFQYALDLKNQGVNVVAINCSFGGGGDDTATTRQWLQRLKAQGIYVFAAAGQQAGGGNLDTNTQLYPAQYGADFDSNVVAVAALDTDGVSISANSNFGPNTVAVAAPGVNVPVVSTLDPINGSANASGTSESAPEAAAAYALIRVYKEPDPFKAALRLKMGAVMLPNLFGKVGYGRVDVYNSLTMASPPSTLALLTEPNSNRALAFESPTMSAGSFPLHNDLTLGTDTNTRVMLFAMNLDLQPGETASAVTAQTQGGIQLPVESVLPVPNLPWLKQVIVKLPNGLASPGDISISITAHNITSNQGIISIR
ncbi:MAG: hypothetical protein AUG51_02785 [Acidobacteria bacterium 13_1_20CM_3_53_8]|nr:MAG: hypothetical protein AUG51_02785 [Acidobacteria bacterium 13_1_20CM_3_53_8]